MNICYFKIQSFSYHPSGKSLHERKQKFRAKLKAWSDKNDPNCKEYPAWMRKDWFSYWTELANDNGRKMRFEMEKTWNTGRRLSTAKRTIYAKDPRWKSEAIYTAPKKQSIDYGNIDYSKYKRDESNKTSSLGERLKKNFNANKY